MGLREMDLETSAIPGPGFRLRCRDIDIWPKSALVILKLEIT